MFSAAHEVEIRSARPDEIRAATGIAVRAFRDNPMSVACWGPNPLRRERSLHLLFGIFLQTMTTPPLIAVRQGAMVGMLGMAAPGTCLHTPVGAGLRLMAGMLVRSPSAANRFRQWMLEYERRDLGEGHWHLGPVAVEPECQRQGIGGMLLQRFCEIVDEGPAAAYLETDEEANVRLYRRFGFEEIGQATILGATNWFMQRNPNPGRGLAVSPGP